MYHLCGDSRKTTKEWVVAIGKQIRSLATVKEGYLYKIGKIRKNWKKRYFVLSLITLEYFDNRKVKNVRD